MPHLCLKFAADFVLYFVFEICFQVSFLVACALLCIALPLVVTPDFSSIPSRICAQSITMPTLHCSRHNKEHLAVCELLIAGKADVNAESECAFIF